MKSLKVAAALLLFFGVLASTLVIRTPLSSLQAHMPSMLQDTESFSGNLINGSVKNLGTVNGPVDLQWQLQLLKLLGGKVGGDIEFDWLQATGNGQMALSASRTVHLNDTVASSPASLIETFLPFVRFGGELRLDLSEGRASQSSYGPFVGVLTWQQATITISEQANLGDINLDMTESDGGTLAKLSSQGGDVQLKGTITLQPDGAYSVDVNAVAQPTASNMVRNTLTQIGTAQSDGSVNFKQSGQLSDLM